MYAFYSLLVYIFYTVFKKEELSLEGEGPHRASDQNDMETRHVSMETQSRNGHTPSLAQRGFDRSSDSGGSSSDSDGLSDEEEDDDDGDQDPGAAASTPLAAFLSFKQEADRRTGSQGSLEHGGKVPESPLVVVMSHLLSFLEQYAHLQQLQQQAERYRSQLEQRRTRHRRQVRALRASYRQRLRDKNSVIGSLEEAMVQQATPRGGDAGEYGPEPGFQAGLHRLVESLCGLQGERSRMCGELHSLHCQLEQSEQERHARGQACQQQIEELKKCIEEREEELSRLRAESVSSPQQQVITVKGVTDSEKRVVCLTAENESLKQSLTVTQGLLQQLSVLPAQSSSMLLKENETLRSRVQQLESSLHQRGEQLSRLERHSEQSEWQRCEELRRREERLRELQLELDKERGKEPTVKYVTRTMEVESPATQRQLAEARERNELLSDKLSTQSETCRQLEKRLRLSDVETAGLQQKIAAYEVEIEKLRRELLKEIGHLEERKEEAVRAAAECSEQQLQSLRQQFMGLQKRLAALPPTLRSVKTDYASLRSQVRNFSDFYGAAVAEAKKQLSVVISEMSEANKDLLEKYRKEVALRRKYHEQLLELKGNIRVLCRVKPVLREDQQGDGQAVVVTTDPDNESAIIVLQKGKSRTFELDKVFQPQATQEEVFQEIEPLVTSCIDGYHVCIFAYGQTGSGKTYTMEGTVENPGINQRALKHLFSEMEDKKDMWTYSVNVSSVEIYNEVLRDLLSKDGEKLDIKMNPDGTGQLHVPGLRVIEVKNFKHIKKILAMAKRNRITFGTQMNHNSSRSHALLTITVLGTDLISGAKTCGKLNLVDLAGSERVWKSGAEGERLKEAQNINRSLLALGDVIQALRGRQTHVPFRNSRLTYLLQDSLGKGNKTAMVVQISALERNVGETMCSLKFAQRVCKVELGPATQKIDRTALCEQCS
nr:kinesin-like protein KIFC3 isoform X1 [Paramormyrops kingsleyae]